MPSQTDGRCVVTAHDDRDRSWGEGDSQFNTTEWTQVLGASLSRSVMGELYKRYRKPVYLYLRGRGFNDEEAKDLIQGFFTDKVLGRRLFEKADREKGRFRTFLLTAIRNYAIDQQRTNKAARSLDEAGDRPASAGDPVLEFDKAWAIQLLHATLEELEAECNNHGRQTHWELFRLWLLEPDLDRGKVKMRDLCARLGIETPARAYEMIFALKDRFRRILRGRLRRQGHSESQIDDEIRDLLDVFSRKSTRK